MLIYNIVTHFHNFPKLFEIFMASSARFSNPFQRPKIQYNIDSSSIRNVNGAPETKQQIRYNINDVDRNNPFFSFALQKQGQKCIPHCLKSGK